MTIKSVAVVAVLNVAALALPLAAQEAAVAPQRRGLLGVTLSCEECFILRGSGRVAYTRYPAFSSVSSSGPAGSAGIQRGDTLISVEGADVTTPEGFERLAMIQPGVPVRVGVRRGGPVREVTVTPGEDTSGRTGQSYYAERVRLAQRLGAEALRASFRTPLGWLGMGLECENCSVSSVGRSQQVWRFRQAPAVLTVDVDGPAHRAGLRRGDTITAIDGTDLTTTEGGRAFAQIEPGQRVVLTARRDGRERRVPLAAVPRPDATREEISAFYEYRRMRDSADASYREILSASIQRAQMEMREMERLMREAAVNRGAIDSSRKRLAAVDSVLRALRSTERSRLAEAYAYTLVTPPTPPTPLTPRTPPTPPFAVAAPAPVVMPRFGVAYPLRYSGRLGDLVNVEARSMGAVNVSEVGDSLIIVSASGFEVRIVRRQR